jgi:uncharacterized damage-inducible protein DinB
MRITSLLVAFAMASATWACAPPASAPPAQTSGNQVSKGIQDFYNSAKKNIQQSAAVMPEDNYSFKPVDTVRTFGQILAHVAGASYLFCAAAKGEAAPHAEDEFEKNATTKAAIDKALADSFTYCDTVYAALTDTTAAETISMPFGMGQQARSSPLIMNAGHLNEHYGNLVTYFRIKGIVPPSSRKP